MLIIHLTEGMMPGGHETSRTCRRTNKEKSPLPPMDGRGGNLNYAMVLPKSEVPPTLIFGDNLQKITNPKQIECGLNTPKKT